MNDIQVRLMKADEKKAVQAIMKRAFSPIQRIFFSWSPDVLVAEKNGTFLGAIVLKIFSLPKGRTGGLIAWIFTAPEARGTGAGQRLTEAGMTYLEERGCDELMACVEGYNSSSFKLFHTRGFSILSPGEQFRRYGWGILSMWLSAFHFVDLGHFLWVRPGMERNDSPTMQWWGTWLLNSLIFTLAIWRGNDFGKLSIITLSAIPLTFLVFFGLRSLGMRWLAELQGVGVRFRAWESGFPISILIALIFGVFYPIPGSFYPTADRWRYRELKSKLGAMALAGILPGLVFTWGVWALLNMGNLSLALSGWLDLALPIASITLIFDVLLIFFPFVSFNGRRIWDWNKVIWFLCALGTVLLFIV